MDRTEHPQLPPPLPVEQPRREPTWQKAVGISIGVCAIVGIIGSIVTAGDDDTTTTTTEQADTVEGQSIDAALAVTWGHLSASEQAQMCDGINEFGLDFAWSIFSDGAQGVPITRDAFDRFYTGVC